MFLNIVRGLTASIIFIPCAAFAASPTSNVSTASVDKGELSIEQRMGYTTDTPGEADHQRFRMRQHIDYGWTDWYATRLVVSEDKRDGDNLEFGSISLENRFQIFEKKQHGWDGGFRLSYSHSDGDKTPHDVELRLVAGVPFADGWEARGVVSIEHEVGEDAEPGALLELRSQVTKAIPQTSIDYIKELRLGVEMFNDFGKLRELNGYDSGEHQFGPVMKMKFSDGNYIQAGYRAGISEASADHLVKVFIGREF